MKKLSVIFILLVLLAACAPQVTPTPEAPLRTTEVPPTEIPPTDAPTAEALPAGDFTLTSERFAEGQPIPEKYSCKGENVSPALAWSSAPKGVKTFALVMDDPDAPGGTWTHWVLYNIPAGTSSLPEAMPATGDTGEPGINSAGNTYYAGPCPPSGTHRYFFKLYALDTALDFSASPKSADLTAAMQGHILGQAELMGTFSK
jgi:Raf kinase inhibitor-like YbhB/YbcL family protein